MIDPQNLPEVGTQIIYVPRHADRKLTHPDCQYGFITGYTVDGNAAFCRYWKKNMSHTYWGLHSDADDWAIHLRTQANSEATPLDLLVVAKHMVPQYIIDGLLFKYGYIEYNPDGTIAIVDRRLVCSQ